MMKKMEKRMKERNDQLRTQLQLRDEYLDSELRKRDQFMEKTIDITPRPKKVYGTYNRRDTYVHQVPL